MKNLFKNNSNKIFLLLISVTGIMGNAQTFIGTYLDRINTYSFEKNFKVIHSQGKTWASTNGVKIANKKEPLRRTVDKNGNIIEEMDDNTMIIIRKDAEYPEYYKNEESNTLLSRNFIQLHSCYIKEDLNQMKWEISEETIVHNGRNCNIATTHFRGKDWTVYFDTSIPFNVAPWKFYGLPGVVVYAFTSDNAFMFELKDFEIKEENTEIKNPFEKEKTISWEQYTKNYRKYLKKAVKWSSDPDDDGIDKIEMGNSIEDLGFKEITGN